MKGFLGVLLIVGALISIFPIHAGEGGHIGGGGDVRRFRSQYARLRVRDELSQYSMFTQLNPRTAEICGPLIDPDSERINRHIDELHDFFQSSDITWNPRSGDECLTVTPGPTLEFHYETCPVATQDGYYFQKVVNAILQNYPDAQNPHFQISTLLAIFRFNSECQKKTGENSRQIIVTPLLASDDLANERLGRATFERGRALATKLLQNVDIQAIKKKYLTLGDVIESNRKQLLQEVRVSPFSFNSSQPSCAFTHYEKGTTIELALSNCLGFVSELDVAWVILHEITHHLGFKEEDYSDLLATEIIENQIDVVYDELHS